MGTAALGKYVRGRPPPPGGGQMVGAGLAVGHGLPIMFEGCPWRRLTRGRASRGRGGRLARRRQARRPRGDRQAPTEPGPPPGGLIRSRRRRRRATGRRAGTQHRGAPITTPPPRESRRGRCRPRRRQWQRLAGRRWPRTLWRRSTLRTALASCRPHVPLASSFVRLRRSHPRWREMGRSGGAGGTVRSIIDRVGRGYSGVSSRCYLGWAVGICLGRTMGGRA